MAAVVADNGSGPCEDGFAGDDAPRVEFVVMKGREEKREEKEKRRRKRKRKRKRKEKREQKREKRGEGEGTKEREEEDGTDAHDDACYDVEGYEESGDSTYNNDDWSMTYDGTD